MDSEQVMGLASLGPARLLAGVREYGRLDLWAQTKVYGEPEPIPFPDLVDLAERVRLCGRGGAGFPFARKLKAVSGSARRRGLSTVVVVNGTEGEPAAWKDKMLLNQVPHLVLDGALLAAWALQAREMVIAIADDGVAEESLLDALAERRDTAGRARVVTVPHRFISGEAGALVRGINGEAHIPPGRKVRASDTGVDGLPTLVSNVETYAQLAVAAATGPREYAAVGTAEEPGTVLATVTGSALRPGVIETPVGMPLKEILRVCGAPTGQGVLTGGYHGTWITAEAAGRAEISRQGFGDVGGSLGAGIILPLPDGTCPLGEVARVMHYLATESAGQCGPCRLGLPEMARLLSGILDGSASPEAVRGLSGAIRGRGACSHPDGSSRFVLSALDTFTDDVSAHLYHNGCGRPVRGVLPIPDGPDDGGAGRLSVDWSSCEGHGLCAHILPELVRLDENGFPSIPDATVPSWLEAQAHRAVDMCPALALRLGGVSGHGGDRTPRRADRAARRGRPS
ncbi:NADH-ubiquinone oxidoreductase-F iron-sulfur binding region domain-containing protein [Dactylosporangium sp. CA-092794]|uniref:NADH-ubiquinone oxidoreductase-F iron-sulfur binding region domain-containing protein n=1 Tax=Dactylosporangium sp. CA-092794 TaxID=3239929 RepID=UPI003D8BD282